MNAIIQSNTESMNAHCDFFLIMYKAQLAPPGGPGASVLWKRGLPARVAPEADHRLRGQGCPRSREAPDPRLSFVRYQVFFARDPLPYGNQVRNPDTVHQGVRRRRLAVCSRHPAVISCNGRLHPPRRSRGLRIKGIQEKYHIVKNAFRVVEGEVFLCAIFADRQE